MPRRATLLYLPHGRVVVSAVDALAGLPLAERVLRRPSRRLRAVIVWLPRRVVPRRAARRLRSSREIVRSPGDRRTREWRSASDVAGRPVTAIGAGTVVSPALLAARDGLRSRGRSRSCDVPAGPDWPESGVLRLAARRAADRAAPRSELAARRRRAAAAAVRRGRRRTAARGSRCGSRRRRISPTPKTTIRRAATRTPTRRSRGSIAACRCRSASR